MSKKILVVDDDVDIRIGMSARLRANGYDVVFAEDGFSATSIARKEAPDLVLLDLGLPAGDGFVVLERLRANTYLATTPVIVISAREAESNEKRALEAGAIAYFQKPVSNVELLEAIARAID